MNLIWRVMSRGGSLFGIMPFALEAFSFTLLFSNVSILYKFLLKSYRMRWVGNKAFVFGPWTWAVILMCLEEMLWLTDPISFKGHLCFEYRGTTHVSNPFCQLFMIYHISSNIFIIVLVIHGLIVGLMVELAT